MRIAVTFAAVAILAWLLVSTRGKDCHYNTHFSKRVVCTKPDR
jgi:hypothetical protein